LIEWENNQKRIFDLKSKSTKTFLLLVEKRHKMYFIDIFNQKFCHSELCKQMPCIERQIMEKGQCLAENDGIMNAR